GIAAPAGAGILLSAATLYKHHTVVYAALLVGAHVLVSRRGERWSRRRVVRDVAVIAGIGDLTWGVLLGYFALTGRFSRVWTTLFVFPSFYSHGMTANLISSLNPSRLFPRIGLPLVLLTLVG